MKRKKITAVMLCLSMFLASGTTIVNAQEEVDTSHNWSTQREYDDTYCWLPCLDEGCDEVTNKLEHSFSVKIDKEATPSENGIAHEECFGCGYQREPFSFEYYAPTVSARTKAWTGDNDIVFDVDSQNSDYIDILIEIYSKEENLGLGVGTLKWVENLDADGKGTITFTHSELEQLKELCDRNNMDIKKMTSLNFLIGLGRYPQGKEVEINIPIEFSEDKPTVVIKNDSGVSMKLPEKVAENLELKVAVSNGSEEKAVIKNVTDIEGDKIKTFDLSLLQDGRPYKYNGQFSSTISLPIPAGWDMNQLALYYFNEETNKAVPVEFVVDKVQALMIFDTNHFSKYVMLQKAGEQVGQTENTPPEGNQEVIEEVKTGDAANVLLWGMLSIVSAGGLMAMLLMKQRRIK